MKRAIDWLVALLRDPSLAADVPQAAWSGIISVARAEVLAGTLAHRLEGQTLPEGVAAEFVAMRAAAAQAQVHALWEAEMCRRALAPLGIAPVLLKGTAYAAAGLEAANGRQIGDLDILVPRERLAEVEAALLDAGWEWVKDDPYDQSYYRDHMHELPPLIHKDRDRMIDVHHTILPLTHRARPNAAAMLADAVQVSAPLSVGAEPVEALSFSAEQKGSPATSSGRTGKIVSPSPPPAPPASGRGGLVILSPADMIIHCAAHLIADGELDGGLRNLWDFHCLAGDPRTLTAATTRAQPTDLAGAVERAARLADHLFGARALHLTLSDRLFLRRLTARDDWGRERHRLLRLAFTVRGHWMRMPPAMLARHLWTKWRKGRAKP